MYSKEHIIKNYIAPNKISSGLAEIMKQYSCSDIQLEKNGKKASVTSIMRIIALCIGPGDKIIIWASGQGEKEAVNAACEFLDNQES